MEVARPAEPDLPLVEAAGRDVHVATPPSLARSRTPRRMAPPRERFGSPPKPTRSTLPERRSNAMSFGPGAPGRRRRPLRSARRLTTRADASRQKRRDRSRSRRTALVALAVGIGRTSAPPRPDSVTYSAPSGAGARPRGLSRPLATDLRRAAAAAVPCPLPALATPGIASSAAHRRHLHLRRTSAPFRGSAPHVVARAADRFRAARAARRARTPGRTHQTIQAQTSHRRQTLTPPPASAPPRAPRAAATCGARSARRARSRAR